jgi:RNA polymerase sigma-70 factor (ECF subfamily)
MAELQSSHNDEERNLVERLQAGDEDAYTEMVERYSSRLRRVALSVLGDPDEAEEVVQETFLNAYESLKDFRGDSSLQTWLYRIALNASLMRLRKKVTALSLERDLEEERLPTPGPAGPEEALIEAERRVTLMKAIDKLPESLREVVLLRDIEGLSNTEAAQVLGISPGAFRVRLHRAHQRLQEELKGSYP